MHRSLLAVVVLSLVLVSCARLGPALEPPGPPRDARVVRQAPLTEFTPDMRAACEAAGIGFEGTGSCRAIEIRWEAAHGLVLGYQVRKAGACIGPEEGAAVPVSEVVADIAAWQELAFIHVEAADGVYACEGHFEIAARNAAGSTAVEVPGAAWAD
jgi:hypothetical protein